ncbi:MAG: hypothetical protein M3464_08200 [Chloroflexota bacterium]|nr:hypothetical protein [Chloroflexota bacterium]
MNMHWPRWAALGILALAGLGAVNRHQGREPVAATPAAVGTPRVLGRDAMPVRAGDSVIVKVEHVILQPEPEYSAARVAMLPQLQTMEATGRVVMRDGERWLELRYPVTGALGWVADRWLRIVPADAAATGTPLAGTGGPTLTGSESRRSPPASRA